MFLIKLLEFCSAIYLLKYIRPKNVKVGKKIIRCLSFQIC